MSRAREHRQPKAGLRTIAGRYNVEAEIAKGGAATVYRVVDQGSGRRIALKQLREPSYSDNTLALFEREYHTLRRLHHPTIIDVFDYGHDDGRPYYTMELLEGRDLRDIAPLPYREACRHVRDVASSLALLHARRLVHRDVSARNVLLTDEGRCKLLDFGGLAPFGVSLYIVGTPPFTAPEVLTGVPLDHRVDLYALGALAYWLLTRRHAFPARDFAHLLDLGRKRPARPSAISEGVPPALDDLVLGLLSRNPLARPSTAAEVIDRLNAIAELEPEESQGVAQSYFASPALIGRDRQFRALSKALEQVGSGQGGMLLVEGGAGMGKTRLLTELAIEAQIADVLVVSVDASMHSDVLGVANAIAVRLIDVAPAEAYDAAKPYAGYLARLSPAVRHRLDATMRASHGEGPAEWRGRTQEALEQWILAVSKRRPLVLAVDNSQNADTSSLALLAALGLEAKRHPLLVVAAAAATTPGTGLEPLRAHARVLRLSALSASETAELARSLFGDVPNVGRLAERLQDASSGNPYCCVEGARRLVTLGVVQYAEGTWVVPYDVGRQPLAADLIEIARQRMVELSAPTRALAEALSLVRGPIRVALCQLLAAEVGQASAFEALDDLIAEGVLLGHGDDYRFAQESLRQTLLDSLDPARRRSLHRRIAESLLRDAPDDSAERIEAGWHLLQAGEESRGADLLAKQAATLRALNVFDGDVHGTTLAVEAALAVYRKQRRSVYEILPLLFALTLCGYFFDRRLVERYGTESLHNLERVSGLALARRLRFLFGGALALLIGLGIGRLRFAFRRRRNVGYDFGLLIVYLVGTANLLCAVATMCLDHTAARRASRVLAPFASLGRRRTTPHIHRYGELLAKTIEEDFANTRRDWIALANIFEDPKEVTLLSDEARKTFLGGIWYALGVLECLHGGGAALEHAKRLESLGVKLYDMVAAQLRAMYHTVRGELTLATRFRDEVELHAIRLGSAWQVEMWWPVSELPLNQISPDVVRLKQALEQLERLTPEVPSLERHAAITRALYAFARGDLNGALAMQEQALSGTKPRSFIGWVAAQGVLAAIHNARGEFEQARAVAEAALSHYSAADRKFVLCISAEVEWALANAGLGDFERATGRLDELLERFEATQNPLVLGFLHLAHGRVALLEAELPRYAKHLAKARRWFDGTNNPALVAQYEALAAQGRRAARASGHPEDTNPPASGPGAAGEVTVRN
jgi:hypothetical protein